MPTPLPTPILTLSMLQYERLQKDVSPRQLSYLTGIDLKRVRVLDSQNLRVREEPWFDEAVAIADALGLSGIHALIGPDRLCDLDLGFDPRNDVDIWRTGCRIPLSHAVRLTLKLGLSDPIHLIRPPVGVRAQIWQIVASGERVRAPGYCPWCAQPPGAHLDTCLPEFFYGPRDAGLDTIGAPPYPRKPGRQINASKKAPGLKRLRAARGTTQAEFAQSVGIPSTSYYSRLEQMQLPLTVTMAQRIAAVYKIDPNELYVSDEVVAAREVIDDEA